MILAIKYLLTWDTPAVVDQEVVNAPLVINQIIHTGIDHHTEVITKTDHRTIVIMTREHLIENIEMNTHTIDVTDLEAVLQGKVIVTLGFNQ